MNTKKKHQVKATISVIWNYIFSIFDSDSPKIFNLKFENYAHCLISRRKCRRYTYPEPT